MLSKAERKYLATEAEPEARAVAGLLDAGAFADRLGPHAAARLTGTYGHVVIIPCVGEEDSLFAALDSIPPGPLGPVLAMVVLNARASAAVEVQAANARTRSRLADVALPAADLWVIDRAQPGHFLPEGEGVGLARKLGADLAAALVWTGRLRSRFLHCTDADVLLPPDYFEQAAPFESTDESKGGGTSGPAALLYRFRHRPDRDPKTARAILLYESYLRYYVLGLRHAGSPYAFQTIGSTFAIDAAAYAQVRGFPKRLAAEDFYLLNKVAKVGQIQGLRGGTITIEGRESDRVPFGTGRAVREILSRGMTEAPYCLPDPCGFDVLRSALEALDAVASGGNPPPMDAYLAEALTSLGAFDLFAKLKAETLDTTQRRRRVHDWFDAFRTLKLLHWVRDHGHPPLPFRDALERASFVPDVLDIPNVSEGPDVPDVPDVPGVPEIPRVQNAPHDPHAYGLESLAAILHHLRTLEEARPRAVHA